MSSSELQKQWATSALSGGNMGYIDELYEDFLADPLAVSEEWRAFFQTLPMHHGQTKEVGHRAVVAHFRDLAKNKSLNGSAHQMQTMGDEQQAVNELMYAYRLHGHLAAHLDPLQLRPVEPVVQLEPANYGLSLSTQQKLMAHAPYFSETPLSVETIVAVLRETYCRHVGFEFMHLSNQDEVKWLLERIEPNHGCYSFDDEAKRTMFHDLVAADGLERYLGTRFVGQKRFSLEGSDALIPMVHHLLTQAGHAAVREVMIGMAHRGRLNMLVNVLGKTPESLFEEFEGKSQHRGTGDVKYHMGFSADLKTRSGQVVHVALGFNPSHLEIIGPVVEGSVRARLHRQQDGLARQKVVPLLIHGDAAFAGQGVIMEMLNFSQARGFCTGGTVHVVINNQIGFTTSNVQDARSTRYCTDVAKMIEAPIFHVNGDDVEAAVYVMQLAFDFRMRFKRDVVIDLVCYRRHGHNEADEPSMTQPDMYQKIKTLRPLRDLYGEALVQAGVLEQATVEQSYERYRDKLDAGKCLVELEINGYKEKIFNNWQPYQETAWTVSAQTTLSLATIKRLDALLHTLPAAFNVHPTIKRLMAERQQMTTGALPLNWGYAETMAYASLLDEGYGLRLTGQDVGRGTFAHRHAVLHDYHSGEEFTPLSRCVKNEEKGLCITDSLLSEEAVLAFEYGYACTDPTTLVLWEAQFGDFANGAQVVIDQFISSGEQKWGRLCGLVMLLPHGYEGQGPEHSSARLERYMQLCAQHNIQVCVPTTPAQIFHVLRRQLIRPFRKPLIVMTPKSLLRHKLAVSPLSDLTEGAFKPLMPEIDEVATKQVTKLILCSGKVYYDLLQARREAALKHIAIIRIEQLYPFPEDELKNVFATYAAAKDVIWCQEEPENQGAWFASQHHIQHCMQPAQQLLYAGRPFAAAPAVGSATLHAKQQATLVAQALGIQQKDQL